MRYTARFKDAKNPKRTVNVSLVAKSRKEAEKLLKKYVPGLATRNPASGTISVKGRRVGIVKKVSTGMRGTHNRDARYERMWALGTDGKIYTRSARTKGYREKLPTETAPAKLFS